MASVSFHIANLLEKVTVHFMLCWWSRWHWSDSRTTWAARIIKFRSLKRVLQHWQKNWQIWRRKFENEYVLSRWW